MLRNWVTSFWLPAKDLSKVMKSTVTLLEWMKVKGTVLGLIPVRSRPTRRSWQEWIFTDRTWKIRVRNYCNWKYSKSANLSAFIILITDKFTIHVYCIAITSRRNLALFPPETDPICTSVSKVKHQFWGGKPFS